MISMSKRFTLIHGDDLFGDHVADVAPDWKLPPNVKARGRAGIADARAALANARPLFPELEPTTDGRLFPLEAVRDDQAA